ncbi:hypothetical protein [Wenxinia marina]|uniref:Stealth protein CR2 conserved region 2 domain-containing protein n=2 Tax=Wenxinia TaxID=653686 RepID=A0A0D0QK10_9RHOB|nr:hypothetical protein [Wenxinia marina]KIQ71343.1 hypothetical protein Wenmar_00113 [Wenxinia marina DSM 24838]
MREAGRSPSGRDVATAPTRFAQQGEIYVAVASLLRFAPFVRRIHIVTDAQRPPLIDAFTEAGLCTPDRIRIVDHREIFAGFEEALPTFNSRSIETMCWRIEGLAPTYLYLNDDFFLAAPTTPSDMFDPAGRLRLQGRWLSSLPERLRLAARPLRRLAGQKVPRPNYRAFQARAAALARYRRRYLRVDHHPHPIRRQTLADWLGARPDLLRAQIAPRFRDAAQFHAISLANHLDLAAGRAVVTGPADFAYLAPGREDVQDALQRVARGEVASGCVQSLDVMPDAVAAEVTTTLAAAMGEHLPAMIRRAMGWPAAPPHPPAPGLTPPRGRGSRN